MEKIISQTDRINEAKKRGIVFLSPPSDYFMAQECYQFMTGNHFWMKWRFEIFKKIIPKNYIWGKTLDIGCGNGIFRKQVEKQYGCEIAGCDLNFSELSVASLGRGPLYFYNIHQRREDFKEEFSTIFLLDVIEHIKDPIDFLKSVSFHLKPGGSLIINVPALQYLYSKYDDILGHNKRYTLKLLKKELSAAGFCLKKSAYWCSSLVPLLLIRKFILWFCPRNQVVKMGFQPPSLIIDFILQSLRRIECSLFSKVPLGTSLMVFARKEERQV